MSRLYSVAIVNRQFETVHKVIQRKEARQVFKELLNGIDEDMIISFKVRKRLTKEKET